MPRKPVDQAAKAPKPAGRERIWQVMREISREGVALTTAEVRARTDINLDTVQSYFSALAAGGWIEAIETPRAIGQCTVYRLLADLPDAPRVSARGAAVTQGAATQQMWSTMRKLTASFTPAELALFASTTAVEVSEAYAADYCIRLARAGYLQRRGGKPARFVFRRPADTGPLSPMIQRTKAVWDRNRMAVVWPVGEPLP